MIERGRLEIERELTQHGAHAQRATCYGYHYSHNGYTAGGKDIVSFAALLCFAKNARPEWSQDGKRYKCHKHEVIPAQCAQILGHLAALSSGIGVGAAAAVEDIKNRNAKIK